MLCVFVFLVGCFGGVMVVGEREGNKDEEVGENVVGDTSFLGDNEVFFA